MVYPLSIANLTKLSMKWVTNNLGLANYSLIFLNHTNSITMVLIKLQGHDNYLSYVGINLTYCLDQRFSPSIGGEQTETFDLEVRVKQRYLMAHVIFNLHLPSATLMFCERTAVGEGVSLT